MDSYESRVALVVNAAHERTTRFAGELRDEEQRFREAAVRDSQLLDQALARAAERQHQPEQPRGGQRTNRDEAPSWADDGDFSDETWLEDFE